MNKEYLEITEQLELFKRRGMIVENEKKSIREIGFYKLLQTERSLAPFLF